MAVWVLLRGLAREAGHWGRFADDLRRAFPGDSVVTPDYPGNGVHHAETSPWAVARATDAIRGRVLAGGTQGPFRLVGLSLGGMVGLDWALRFPDEIEGLVLINTSVGTLSSPWARLRLAALGQLLRVPVARRAESRERLIHAITSNVAAGWTEVAPAWLTLASERPTRVGNAIRQLYAAARFRPVVRSLALGDRLLVLVSERDRLVNPACSRRLAEATGAVLEQHPQAGHDLPLDDPTWTVDAIARWQAQLATTV